MTGSERPLIIITGATATGKSALAERIAERHNGVIINGDMGQMYEPLTLGTAKPLWKGSAIPHYLFDVISEPAANSALQFRIRVQELLKSLPSDKLPILVGGSCFHLATLFFPPTSQGNPSKLYKTLGDKSPKEVPDKTPKELWECLAQIDPERAANIHPNDTYRIERALEIAQYAQPSQCKPVFDPVHPSPYLIQVTCERALLYERINARVHTMLAEGWVDEVRSLSPAWHAWLLSKKIIGYDTIVTALHEDAAMTQLPERYIAMIQQKTRNYAKWQMTFLRSLARKLASHNVIFKDCDPSSFHHEVLHEWGRNYAGQSAGLRG